MAINMFQYENTMDFEIMSALFDELEVPTIRETEIALSNYLGYFEEKDLPAPVVKGFDKYGRKFIALLVHGTKGDVPFRGVLTFYQYYRDSKPDGMWSMCVENDDMPTNAIHERGLFDVLAGLLDDSGPPRDLVLKEGSTVCRLQRLTQLTK